MLDVEFVCTKTKELEEGTIGFQHQQYYRASHNCIEKTGTSEVITEKCMTLISNIRHYSLEHWSHSHITEIFESKWRLIQTKEPCSCC